MELSCSLFASRIIQGIFERLNFKNQEEFINASLSNLFDLIKDCNGLYVILRIMEEVKKNEEKGKFFNNYNKGKEITLSFFYDIIKQNLENFCFDKYGCCFVQKSLGFAYPQVKEEIISLLMKNKENFLEHSYGNYVIQEIISFKDNKINQEILDLISLDLVSCCMKKPTANIIEKLLKNYKKETQRIFDNEIKTNNNFIRDLVTNNYGNYGKLGS